MPSNNAKIEKKKVALNQQTYDKLKDFSRFNGLKLRLVVDTFVDLLEGDEALREQVIKLTLAKQDQNQE